jgi:hypothetical protein
VPDRAPGLATAGGDGDGCAAALFNGLPVPVAVAGDTGGSLMSAGLGSSWRGWCCCSGAGTGGAGYGCAIPDC